MQARNVRENADGTYDMEIEHPSRGWIPFTASADDVEAHGRELHAKATAGELGPLSPYVAPTPEELLQRERDSAFLTPMEFQLALDDAGLLDQIEAAIPTLPKRIQVMWNKATVFERNYPELVQMAHQLGITDEQIDAVFGIGS